MSLSLSATTDKLLYHSNRGMADIFRGVSGKKQRNWFVIFVTNR